MRALLLLVALVAAGCGSTPYAEVFIGYRLSDGGFASCSDENAGVRLGTEWALSNGYSVSAEYEHVSHLLCGKPFHGKGGTHKEDFTDHAGIKFRKEWQ